MIVGFNPGLTSAQLGHYYAYPGNRFWRLLHASGIVPQPLGPTEDRRLVDFGVGLTDIVKRPSASSSDLSAGELARGAKALRRKLDANRPAVVAFCGKGIWRAFSGQGGPCDYGPAPQDMLAYARVFVVPSPSGRSGLPYRTKLDGWRQLADALPPWP